MIEAAILGAISGAVSMLALSLVTDGTLNAGVCTVFLVTNMAWYVWGRIHERAALFRFLKEHRHRLRGGIVK